MAKSNVWMSVSDLMTGLMVIFLFIAIAYISRVKQNQTVLTDYIETKTNFTTNLLKNSLVILYNGKWLLAKIFP